MRQLLGREPGQPPDEMTTAATSEGDEAGRLSPEASVTYMKAWLEARGGQGRA
jgi:hypothetical protein